jgi:hypothetical protein
MLTYMLARVGCVGCGISLPPHIRACCGCCLCRCVCVCVFVCVCVYVCVCVCICVCVAETYIVELLNGARIKISTVNPDEYYVLKYDHRTPISLSLPICLSHAQRSPLSLSLSLSLLWKIPRIHMCLLDSSPLVSSFRPETPIPTVPSHWIT